MATTPVPIDAVILNSATTIYDPFVTLGATLGMLVSMHIVNTGSSDVTVDIYIDKATDIYIADDKTVPAKGNLDWTGIVVINSASTNLVAIASTTSVLHITGCVMENA